MPAQEDHQTAQADNTPVVFRIIRMTYQHTPEVLPPGEQPFHFPPACIPSEGAAILRLGRCPVRSRRGDHRNPRVGQAFIAGITIVSFVPDQTGRSSSDRTRGERWCHKGDFMRRSACNVDGDRKTSAVCNCHDLRPFAPLGLSHPAPPFFATPKGPSMKHSDRSSPPRSWRSVAKVRRMWSSTPRVGSADDRFARVESVGANPSIGRRCASSRASRSTRLGARARDVPGQRRGAVELEYAA
jgi:hypothetical protein